MKNAIKITFKLMVFYWKRSLSFICLIALLATAAGLLGNIFLSDEVSISKVSVAIVNNDDSQYTDMLVSEVLKEAKNSSVIEAFDVSENKGYSLLEEGEISALLILPKGFLNSVLGGENLSVQVVYNPSYPVQSLIIQTVADELVGLLEASQTGIYTTLDYVGTHAPEAYDNAYLRINTRYIKNVMAFKSVVNMQTISPVGEVGFFVHYLGVALFVLLMLGACLYIPIIKENFKPEKIGRILKLKNKASSLVLSVNIGWWINQSLIALILFITYALVAIAIDIEVSPIMILALIIITWFTTVFGVFISFSFKNSVGNLILIIYTLLNLFFSGGILPMVFFNDNIKALAKLFPGYYGTELLKSSIVGKFDLYSAAMLAIISTLILLVTTLVVKRKEAV